MMLVIDTNVFVISLTSRSPYHKIFTSLRDGKFSIAVTSDILLEYHEVISQKYSPRAADELLNLISELSNVHFITTHYNWQLITIDSDDNKFVDCTVAAAADYLVTQDKHFNVLQQIDFPKVNLLNVDQLMRLL